MPSPKKILAHTYALTSYNGADTEEYLEQSDESPTLLGSLESREVNDRRRIQALKSHGILVNDISLVSNEPEVFSLPKPIVWDYLVDEWDPKNRSSDGPSGTEQMVASDPIAQSGTSAMAEGNSPGIIENCTTFGSMDIDRGSQPLETQEKRRDRRRPMIPFLQWDDNKGDKDRVGGDIVVRRVLDQVDDRLSRNSDHFKIYKKSHASTLEDLEDRESPLYAATSGRLTDKILSFRDKTAEDRRGQLFRTSKNLIEMFIPINFDHDVTRKIWGAVHTICQTLNGIFRPTPDGCGDLYLVQDYTGENDLTDWLGLTQPESPLQGCTKCSRGFKNLEDGIAHLGDEHFCTNSTSGNLGLWLRTPQQIHVEARINTFLTLLDECTDAFKKLNIISEDLHFGSLKGQNTSEAKGYPVFESLVRVFEHITTILVFSCNFMVKADKDLRKSHLKVSNGKPFKSRLRDCLHQIVLSAQEDLAQARDDIILAGKTERRPGDITLASIGPEFMIATISNGLFLHQPRGMPVNSISPNDTTGADSIETSYIDVNEVYKRYANKLQLQVNQRPQKRLLPAIYALEEELDILLRLNQWQRKFCHDFRRCLDPVSYRITTKARLSCFGTENYYLLKTIRRLEVQYNELQGLQKRSEKLRDQLQQSIEIEEESHGKAIRVFTFVTLFFLPLSFVTSFFGMNTVDIRDIDQGQRLFWFTSVPTTTFVIGVAYLYGYKWETWKERLIRRRSRNHTKHTTELLGRISGLTNLRRLFWDTDADNDLEKGGGQRRGTDLSFMSIESATHPQKNNSQ
ncbi:hypothetical protein F4801DRAFT_112737 [Xylaria longipes]|nr:hypothetical protein F4801DRAFT_112737 [Xylaria longipes]